MLTGCPRCERVLTCQAARLKATRGLVRCGHCRAVFNAWAHLLDLMPSPAPAASALPAVPETAPRAEPPPTPSPIMAMSALPAAEAETRWASEPIFERSAAASSPRALPEPAAAAGAQGSVDADDLTHDLALPMRPRQGDPDPDAATQLGLEVAVATEATAAAAPSHLNLPVDPPWYRQERPPERNAMGWVWGVLLMVLLMLLLAQVAWLQAGRIAIEWPASRPLWVQLCDQLGCELPWQRAVERIKVRQSDVREQPGPPEGLLLTVTLVNEATFEQPYPAIDLSLGDGSEPNTARRRFTPEEYLGPEGRYRFLPVGQAVQIALKLAGRHDLATTYTIELH